MAYHGNPYSPEEDAIIRECYAAGKPLWFMAARCGRTLYSIGSRAQALGLRHPNGTRNSLSRHGQWSMVLDDLTNNIPTLPYVPGIIVTGRYTMTR